MADAGALRETSDDRCSVVSSHRVVPYEEQRPFGPLADGSVNGLVGGRVEHDLRGPVPLTDDVKGGLVAGSGEVLDPGAAGFGYAQAVESEQAREGVGVAAEHDHGQVSAIVVRDVPAIVCDLCEETYYEPAVTDAIVAIIDVTHVRPGEAIAVEFHTADAA